MTDAPPEPRANTVEDELPQPVPLPVVVAALATPLGIVAVLLALRAWFPALHTSLLGPAPKAYWYLSRASAFTAFGLLWVSMALGLGITNRLARAWPGGPAAYDLHQYTGLLGLLLALFHAAILLGDRYIGYTPLGVLVPFAGGSYRPAWVGLGQVALYLLALVWLSASLRQRLGRRWWRRLHYLSFAVFALALAHGILSGTDSSLPLARGLYWASGVSIIFLLIYRLLVTAGDTPKPTGDRAARSPRGGAGKQAT